MTKTVNLSISNMNMTDIPAQRNGQLLPNLLKKNCGINIRILLADTLHLSCCLWHREK